MYNKQKPLRVFEAFAGYGSQSLALDRLKEEYPDFDYTVVGISEIDKYAIKAYNALHPGVHNFGDICKVEWEKVPDFDFLTYSFPCTDISNAGLQRGLSKDSGTRSSLVWECERAIRIKRPAFLILENVKNLCGKKFVDDFNAWLDMLDKLGYENYWQVCNAKDYGVPQNRERVFVISYRRDLELPPYVFPEKIPLDRCLADVLEEDVEEKFYLSDERISGLMASSDAEKLAGRGFKFVPKDGSGIGGAITSKAGSRKTDNFVYDCTTDAET